MVFSSTPFIFYFLPLLLCMYYVVPARLRFTRNLVLLLASLIFYGWGEGIYIIVLLVSIFINHYLGRLIFRSNARRNLLFGIFINLLILGVYKYSGFITEIFGFTNWNTPELPLGISFFTFQAISYLIDVSRKDAKATSSIIDTALYICSFPQLIAGPIVRYRDVALQLIDRNESIDRFALGIKIFILGLAQKVLIANIVGEVADNAFTTPAETLSTLEAWYGLTAYSLQIFFDFAGYSNMAIGLGHMFGFKFPQNFRAPYASLSVTEFWRRWHMTLSNWFRDYLYIPLGGNRVSTLRGIFNLWIVFLLCGFWHGADWVFILWGAWHGLFLSIERIGLLTFLDKLFKPIRQLYLLLVVFLGWVLFRADSIEHALNYYTALFGLSAASGTENILIVKTQIIVFMLIAFCFAGNISMKMGHYLTQGQEQHSRNAKAKSASLLIIFALFILCLAAIASDSYNAFIYFRF